MASWPGKLTPLQHAVLDAFFARESDFYLTGGAALAAVHLAHRTSDDLDLFTLTDDVFERGEHALLDVADDLRCAARSLQRAPGFRRFILTRESEGVIVDLVRERVPQWFGPKSMLGAIRVDPAPEILANKLTALAGRAEIRDLVDVRALEQAGFHVDDVLEAALDKDGGATPATLAWVLSEIEIPDQASLRGERPAGRPSRVSR